MREAPDALPTRILLDVDAEHLTDCCGIAMESIVELGLVDRDHRAGAYEALTAAVEAGPAEHGHHVAVLHGRSAEGGGDCAVLLRLREPIEMVGERRHDGIWFVWILLSRGPNHAKLGTVAEFAHLVRDPQFLRAFLDAPTPDALRRAYVEALHADTHFEAHIPEELRPTGRLLGGVLADMRRRGRHYASDWTDGFTPKSVASVLFLYFACLAPSIAFGGLLALKTHGEIGAIEMLVSTAVCGIVYALVSAQPLTILGSTGPVIIFLGILYSLCASLGVPFLPTMAWVGLWTMVLLLILAATGASSLIRYFTRFTDDTFAGLIALIFVYEAASDTIGVFRDPNASPATALLSMNLALGTFMLASALRQFRRKPYLVVTVREFLADFGPAIAIVTLAVLARAFPEVELAALDVPDHVATSTGRPWLVNPFDAPMWVWAASIAPAVLVTILLYLDQNITVRLVNNPEYGLKKGAGYHLDLAVVGLLVGVCSLFGLPWMVAATVRSLNHVRSLARVEAEGERDRIVSVVETRMTGLGVHLGVAASLLLLPLLRTVPMSVLFGLFLFMGISAMSGNQLFERVRLWATDPRRYPPTYYLRAVPRRVVHGYTAIQAGCLVVLWVVKTSAIGILFPLFIGLLVPVRMWMGRTFDEEHLALLDAEEEPHEEVDREGA